MVLTLAGVLIIVAIVLFVVAAFNPPWKPQVGWVGLAFLAASFLFK
ncbi:MAG TPA: hypothetical protein VIY48_20745 [Candidatus Paceibacterota bacterium]